MKECGAHHTEDTGVARVEDSGPLTETWIRQHLTGHGAGAKVTVRPVLDIEGQAPVDAYEIPDRHRRAVHLMTPADCLPTPAPDGSTQPHEGAVARAPAPRRLP